MNQKTELNNYFNSKFEEVSNSLLTYTDEKSKFVAKQLAYFFYLQGQVHSQKWNNGKNN
jgi:hypothetical protein